MAPTRTRRDRCPGILRPWPADDGGLVRVRLVGGQLSAHQLRQLSDVATTYGDGNLHVTSRANLQIRALPMSSGSELSPLVVAAVAATGLLPSREHDLVRNVMVSPLTGISGGRADLRPVARRLDELLVADPALAALPGKFLFVLDDGRGDLAGRETDLGLVALDARVAQLRIGSSGWGEAVGLGRAPATLLDLAREFLDARGTDRDAAWHVDDLPSFHDTCDPEPRALVASPPPAYGEHGDHVHVPVHDGVLDPALVDALTDALPRDARLVVTPWRGMVLPR